MFPAVLVTGFRGHSPISLPCREPPRFRSLPWTFPRRRASFLCHPDRTGVRLKENFTNINGDLWRL